MKLFQIAWGDAAAVEGVSLPEWEVALLGLLFAGKLFLGVWKKAVGCPGATGGTWQRKQRIQPNTGHAEGKQIPLGLNQFSRQNWAGQGWVRAPWITRHPCRATVPFPALEEKLFPALLPSQPSPARASCEVLASIPCDTDVPAPTDDDTYEHTCRVKECARWPLPVFLGKGKAGFHKPLVMLMQKSHWFTLSVCFSVRIYPKWRGDWYCSS